jgi:hypothetical protein
MPRRKPTPKLTKADARQINGARQVKFLSATQEMWELIQLVRQIAPALAGEMEDTLLEIRKAVPTSDTASRVKSDTYTGREDRRRRRYEERKARHIRLAAEYAGYENMQRRLLRRLRELDHRYNAPLLPEAPQPQPAQRPTAAPLDSVDISSLLLLQQLLTRLQPAQQEAPPVDDQPLDMDVWGDVLN